MPGRSVLLIGFVGIFAFTALAAQSEEEKPAPAEASITANLNGDPRTIQHKSSDYVAVRMAGEPTEGETTLVDATGLLTAKAEPVSAEQCEGTDIRSSGVGTDIWCLQLTGLDVGDELTGKIKGDANNLTLKVNERYHFIWGPLLTILLGLLLSIGWTWATTRGLPSRVPLSRLRRLLNENNKAEANKKIVGLEEWARPLETSLGATAVLKTIKEVQSTGLSQAQESRQSLSEALEKFSLRRDHPLRLAAKTEADRTDHKIEDFYKEDGKPQEEHPAVANTKLLDSAEKLRQRIAEAESDIGARVPASLRPRLTARAAFVREELDAAGDANGLERASTLVDLLEEAIFNSVGVTDDAIQHEVLEVMENLDGFDLRQIALSIPRSQRLKQHVRGLNVDTSGWKLADFADAVIASGVVLGILALIQTIVAVYTVGTAVYAPNQSFGTAADWIALAAAAFASSSAAGIVGLAAIGETKDAE